MSQFVKDKWMILDPSEWPCRPTLSMKRRRHGDTEPGIIIAGRLTTVYLCNMFDQRLKGDLKLIEHKEYKDVDTLLGDGWVVD